MSDRIRLTIATVLTGLLLAAVSVGGIALHTGTPAPTTAAPAQITTQAAHAAPIPHWNEEHD